MRLALLLLLAAVPLGAAEPADVLVVVGPSKHPPGTHEVAAGGRLLAHLLERTENVPGLQVRLVYEWPAEELRATADTVVFLGDTFPPNRFPAPERNLAELGRMMDRGAGLVALHYATGLLGEDVTAKGDHPLLGWMGGYFANRSCPHHQSIARVYEAALIEPAAPEHPVSRGWEAFTLHDEPYIRNYFGPGENRPAENVTALATSMLPPEAPRREVVAWAIEREDGGRGVAVVMPHFYKNWRDNDLRRLILNAIVWSAGREVPPEGVETSPPDLAEFEPQAVEPQPRR